MISKFNVKAMFLLGMLLMSFAALAQQAQPTLPTVVLKINGLKLNAELASNEGQRYMGLSFRESLADDAGMLFIYPNVRPLTFTMRNTLIPLSIAFISPVTGTTDLVINEIQLMNVGPNQLFPSKKPAQYALEVNQGWFAANGIKPGAIIQRQWP